MARILWLDDKVDLYKALRGRLLAEGHDLTLVHHDREAEDQLDTTPGHDLIVQNLMRGPGSTRHPSVPGILSEPSTDAAGWSFCETVLRERFPQIPVVIYSATAGLTANRAKAEDFNLAIVAKADPVEELLAAIRQAESRQRTVLQRRPLPLPGFQLDFERVNSHLLRHLSLTPSDLDLVSWATFERLVETLLREMGYEVHHTRLTRDGGVDLWAVQRSTLGETLYAIDAKKFRRDRLLGPEPVRAIYGVADLAGASTGMIVTTARFGPEAMRLATHYRYRISLKDYDHVTAWIRSVAGKV